jgi:hypothetical protein
MREECISKEDYRWGENGGFFCCSVKKKRMAYTSPPPGGGNKGGARGTGGGEDAERCLLQKRGKGSVEFYLFSSFFVVSFPSFSIKEQLSSAVYFNPLN